VVWANDKTTPKAGRIRLSDLNLVGGPLLVTAIWIEKHRSAHVSIYLAVPHLCQPGASDGDLAAIV
jgi:hypothetical protein